MFGFVRSLINSWSDRATRETIRQPYGNNLMELFSTSAKVSPWEIGEIALRAGQGKPPERPFGSITIHSPWDRLLFSPVHLWRMPTEENTPLDFQVQIGPRSQKPLRLGFPVLIAGMSYGSAISKKAKVALAQAATRLGTATNSGESFLPEEREAAAHLILQYHRGTWPKSPQNDRNLLQKADALEIQVGQGAQGSAPQRTIAQNIDAEMRQNLGLGAGEDAVVASRLAGVAGASDFRRLVADLHQAVQVPVGIKFGAGDHLEQELAIALEAGVDFITIDGGEGGTHGTAPTLEDDLGIPTLYALDRAFRFLEQRGMGGQVTLLATGGLKTPGQMAKALALGADAVYIGTAAVLALVTDQSVKALPFEPPTSLALQSGSKQKELNVEQATTNLQNFLEATKTELSQLLRTLGKTRIGDLARDDLCTTDGDLARILGIRDARVAPGREAEMSLPLWAPPEVPRHPETEQPLAH